MRDVFRLECWHSRFPVGIYAIPRYDYEPESRDTHSGRNSNTARRDTTRRCDISVTPRQCVSSLRARNCREFGEARAVGPISRARTIRTTGAAPLLTVQVVKGAEEVGRSARRGRPTDKLSTASSTIVSSTRATVGDRATPKLSNVGRLPRRPREIEILRVCSSKNVAAVRPKIFPESRQRSPPWNRDTLQRVWYHPTWFSLRENWAENLRKKYIFERRYVKLNNIFIELSWYKRRRNLIFVPIV